MMKRLYVFVFLQIFIVPTCTAPFFNKTSLHYFGVATVCSGLLYAKELKERFWGRVVKFEKQDNSLPTQEELLAIGVDIRRDYFDDLGVSWKSHELQCIERIVISHRLRGRVVSKKDFVERCNKDWLSKAVSKRFFVIVSTFPVAVWEEVDLNPYDSIGCSKKCKKDSSGACLAKKAAAVLSNPWCHRAYCTLQYLSERSEVSWPFDLDKKQVATSGDDFDYFWQKKKMDKLPLSGCPFKDYSLEGLSPKPGLALWFCSYAWLCGYLRDKPVYSGSQGTFLLAYFPALTCVYAQALSFAAQHVCANLKAKKLKKEYLKLQA